MKTKVAECVSRNCHHGAYSLLCMLCEAGLQYLKRGRRRLVKRRLSVAGQSLWLCLFAFGMRVVLREPVHDVSAILSVITYVNCFQRQTSMALPSRRVATRGLPRPRRVEVDVGAGRLSAAVSELD